MFNHKNKKSIVVIGAGSITVALMIKKYQRIKSASLQVVLGMLFKI